MKTWVARGQPYREFWGLTLREVDLILTAAGDAEVRRVRTARSLNYELAALIRVGFHDPKKFPGYDTFMGNKERATARPDDLHDYLMALSLRPSSNPKTKG